MRLSIMRLLLVGVAIASAPAVAQQSNSAPTQSDELASTHRAWQQARDTEEKIGFGERALALEPEVATWPLDIPRRRFTAEVSAGLGALYAGRSRGVFATTWKRRSDICKQR